MARVLLEETRPFLLGSESTLDHVGIQLHLVPAGPHRAGAAPAFSALQAVRAQAAFLRPLLDEVERLAPRSAGADGLSDQVVEELARLGCTSLEAAAELTKLLAAARAAA